jgi:hypothetical protein
MRVNHTLLKKLIALPPREWVDLLAAQVALLHAQILLWTRPRGRLLERSETAVTTGGDVARVRRLALAVERAAEYGLFRPTCLVRAVAVHRMLESHGFAGSRIRVGIQQKGGRFLAHAWVDYGGSVLADQEWRVKEFDEFTRMELTQVL